VKDAIVKNYVWEECKYAGKAYAMRGRPLHPRGIFVEAMFREPAWYNYLNISARVSRNKVNVNVEPPPNWLCTKIKC